MISTIEAYNAEISRIVTSIGDRKRILYRGQRNASWEIKSSLERHGKNRIACEEYYKIIDRYKPLLNPIIDEKFERKSDRTGYPFDFKEYEEGSWTLPEMEYLTYLRHHGFPTPLIDWTASPYVALFFACEDFIESKTCGKVYAYAPPKNRISGNEVPDLRHIGKYVEAGKRHFAQQSEYLIPTVYISEWEFIPYDEVIQNHENDQVCVEINRCGSEYNRGTGCGKTARPGLCGGCRVTGIPTTTKSERLFYYDRNVPNILQAAK